MPAFPSYAIVSPVKDEAAHFARTAESLIRQSVLPELWVVVDDGSTDGTTEIAERYASEHDWIEVVRRSPGQPRARGGAVVAAFKEGLAHADATGAEAEVIVKLDGDLYLPPHYFEWVLRTFSRDPLAGIVGGRLLVPSGQSWEFDAVNPATVHGAIKAYSRGCFDAIGGLHESMGWDGIDHFAARARGWKVIVLSELTALHYTPRGSKQGALRPRWEEGRGSHWMGYTLPMAMLRAGYRMLIERPRFIGGAVLGVSFLWHRLRSAPQVPDRLAIEQVEREQRSELASLVRGHPRTLLPPCEDGPAYFATGFGTVSEPVRNAE